MNDGNIEIPDASPIVSETITIDLTQDDILNTNNETQPNYKGTQHIYFVKAFFINYPVMYELPHFKFSERALSAAVLF